MYCYLFSQNFPEAIQKEQVLETKKTTENLKDIINGSTS